MKISVLIALAGPNDRLVDSLASVGAQTHPDWELLVGDATASNATQEIIRGFGERWGRPVRYERLELAGAVLRNRLLAAAGGDALAFLEPGDTWMPRHLATAEQYLGTGGDLVVSDARIWHASRELFASAVVSTQLTQRPVRALFSRNAICSPSCVTLRRETAGRVGWFDPHCRVGEARDYWLRCALADARFVATHRTTCQRDPGARPDAGRALAEAEQSVAFYDKYRDLGAVPAALRRRLLAGSLVALGRLLRASDPPRAARCFLRAWSLQPVHLQTLGQYALTGWRSNPTEPSRTALALGESAARRKS